MGFFSSFFVFCFGAWGPPMILGVCQCLSLPGSHGVPSHRKGCVKDIFSFYGVPLLSRVPTVRQDCHCWSWASVSDSSSYQGSVSPAPVASPAPTTIIPLIQGYSRVPWRLLEWRLGMEGATGDHQPLFLFLRSLTCAPSDGENEVGGDKGSFRNFSLPLSPRISRLVDLGW